MAISTPLILILSSVLFTTSLLADDSNVLLTGDTLATDGQLTYQDTAFIMQDDCNLVLYNGANGFQSNTHRDGQKCTLTLNNRGQLVIKSLTDGTVAWTSTPPQKPGNYAALLRPDGNVVVYGPTVWSTPQPSASSDDDSAVYDSNAATGDIPLVKNVLFSSQILYNNATLTTRDYTLMMGFDCDLELSKAGAGVKWRSGTAGKGRHCFLRLDHVGQLTVVDDKYRSVWASKPVGKQDGAYVLVLQMHGQAVVYGPTVWSTNSS